MSVLVADEYIQSVQIATKDDQAADLIFQF